MKHHGWKRAGLVALAVVGGLIALICLALGTTFLVLQTSWAGERLRRKVVEGANQQIQGRLDIGRLSFGGDRLVLWDVALSDPEGQPVGRVARAEVEFRILRLLRKEVRITAVSIEKPHLGLVSGPDGLNLTRATAPRQKVTKKDEGPAPDNWVVQLDRFDLKDGSLGMISVSEEGGTEEKVRLEDLQSFFSARYATGDGALSSTFRLTGRSALAPGGPFRIETQANKTSAGVHFVMDSEVLGGTAKVRADLPQPGSDGAKNSESALHRLDAEVKVAIPKTSLHGFGWGPIQVDGVAHPGSAPRLEMLVAIPGVELTGTTGKTDNQSAFDFHGRLSVIDLALTAKAAQALLGGDSPAATGRGQIDFSVGGPAGMKGAPAAWGARWDGKFERLRFADNIINGLSLDGRVAHLSSQPGEVDLKLAIDSVDAGDRKFGKIALATTLRQQDLSVDARVATPQPLNLMVKGRIDDDRKGFSLATLSLGYPQVQWELEKPARIRSADQSITLSTLRLVSQEKGVPQGISQALSVEGSKAGEQLNAHLVVDKLRLDLLPELVADPRLHLGGTLDVDVKATGVVDNPKVTAHLALKQARFQATSRINVKVDATLADQVVDGSLSAETPFTAAEARFKVPTDPLAPGAPLDVRLDVTRLDLGDALRTVTAAAAPADGKVTVRLQASGSADNPSVDVVINARELSVTRPPAAKGPGASSTPAADAVDVGHARIHLAYARRTVRADIDFGATHGGTLKVDAVAKIDLSYPRVTRRRIVPAKIPIEGKVVAHELDVAWISQFNERVETLGGQVNANAKLTGTVGDPHFLGDVRWKNGKVVATVPKATLKAVAKTAAKTAGKAVAPAPAEASGTQQ